MGYHDDEHSELDNHPWKLSLFSKRPIQRIQDCVADKARDTPEDSTDISSINIPSMTRYLAIIQVNRHEEGSQQERIRYIKGKTPVRIMNWVK